jgi:carboxymethylenebutenolidase
MPASDISSSTIELSTADGIMPVVMASPTPVPTRGVVVVQDVFGVTGYIEAVAADLAAAGWYVLAPHLYHRDGSPVMGFDEFPRAAGHMKALTGPGLRTDLDACLTHMASLGILSERTAVMGFCMGGTVAHFAAVERPIGAAVTFYGQAAASGWEGVAPAIESSPRLRAPWLGLFGATDPIVAAADVERLRLAAQQASVATNVICYPGVGHAFHRFSTPGTYHPETAAQAWRECTTWLDRYIPFSPPMTLTQPEHIRT